MILLIILTLVEDSEFLSALPGAPTSLWIFTNFLSQIGGSWTAVIPPDVNKKIKSRRNCSEWPHQVQV